MDVVCIQCYAWHSLKRSSYAKAHRHQLEVRRPGCHTEN